MRPRLLAAQGAIALICVAAGIALIHNVEDSPSPEAVLAASAILRKAAVPRNTGRFDEQMATIGAAQRAVLAAAPVDQGIPQGQSRELPDLLRAGKGLCFDRSRAIETVLRVAGFEVRHVAIYSLADGRSPTSALITPQVSSHAVTEAKTARGWIVVDSNIPWLGLTKGGNPVSMEELSEIRPESLAAEPHRIFQDDFTWVYGLYSRHGRFYPPYNPVPDVNWRELAGNI